MKNNGIPACPPHITVLLPEGTHEECVHCHGIFPVPKREPDTDQIDIDPKHDLDVAA